MHTFVINKRPEKLYNEYGNMLNNGQPSEKSHDQDKLCHSALSFDWVGVDLKPYLFLLPTNIASWFWTSIDKKYGRGII